MRRSVEPVLDDDSDVFIPEGCRLHPDSRVCDGRVLPGSPGRLGRDATGATQRHPIVPQHILYAPR